MKTEGCIHYWIIETPIPGVEGASRGVCRKCSEEKDFFNSIEAQDHAWVEQGHQMACFGRRAPEQFGQSAPVKEG